MLFIAEITVTDRQDHTFTKGIVADNIGDAKNKAEAYAKKWCENYLKTNYFIPPAGSPSYKVTSVTQVSNIEEMKKLVEEVSNAKF